MGLLSCTMLFVCLYVICDSRSAYRAAADLVGYDYSWESSDPAVGLGKADIVQIGSAANIDKVVYTSEGYRVGDNSIYLDYQGQTDDPYRVLLNGQTGETHPSAGLVVHMVTLPENSPMWEYYIPDGLDEGAFLRGEQLIAFLPDVMETEYGYTAVNTFGVNTQEISGPIHSPDLRPGEQVRLSAGEQGWTVTCGHILKRFPSQTQTAMDFLSPGAILVSEALFQRVFELEEPRYSLVLAFGNSKSAYDVGDKLMSAITQNQSISFTNHRVEKAAAYTAFRVEAVALGGISAFFCGLAIVIIYRNRMRLYEAEGSRIRLLRQLGCGEGLLSAIYRRSLAAILVPMAAALNLAVVPVLFYQKFGSHFAGERLLDTWRLTMQRALHGFPLPLLLLPQVIYFIGLALAFRRPIPQNRF